MCTQQHTRETWRASGGGAQHGLTLPVYCMGHCLHRLYMSVASFPGLPRFYLPFVFIILHESGRPVLIFVDLLIPCVIVNAKGRSKRGRPGTEASMSGCPSFLHQPFLCIPCNSFSCYIIVHVSLLLVHDQSSELGCSVLSR